MRKRGIRLDICLCKTSFDEFSICSDENSRSVTGIETAPKEKLKTKKKSLEPSTSNYKKHHNQQIDIFSQLHNSKYLQYVLEKFISSDLKKRLKEIMLFPNLCCKRHPSWRGWSKAGIRYQSVQDAKQAKNFYNSSICISMTNSC